MDNKHKSCKSHCCRLHYCKYGYDDCPVETGQVIQDYPCEICNEFDIDTIEDVQNELLFQTLEPDEKEAALHRGLDRITALAAEYPNGRWVIMKKWLEFLIKINTKRE